MYLLGGFDLDFGYVISEDSYALPLELGGT